MQYTPERLAKFDNKVFHLSNIYNNFKIYAYRNKLVLSKQMPYVRFQNLISNRNDPEARMDLVEKIASIVWSMPLLTFFVILGCFCDAKDGYGRNIKYIFIFGSIPMILTMLSAVAVTHRYIIDFLPSHKLVYRLRFLLVH